MARARPRVKSRGRNRAKLESRAKPEKERGRDLGRVIDEPLQEFFGISNFKSFDQSGVCIIVETEILK